MRTEDKPGSGSHETTSKLAGFNGSNEQVQQEGH